MTSAMWGADRRAWLAGTLSSLKVPSLLIDATGVALIALWLAGVSSWAVMLVVGSVIVLSLLAMSLLSSRSAPAGGSGMGEAIVGKLSIVVASSAWLSKDTSPALTSLCLGVLSLAIIVEPLMRRLLAASDTAVFGIEGAPSHSGRLLSPWLAVWSTVPALAVLVVATALGAGAFLVCLVCLLAGLMTMSVLASAAMAAFRRRRQEAALPAALLKLAPRFVLYWTADADSAYQVAMWLPLLERCQVPFVVIVRSHANFMDVRRLTRAPVVHVRQLEELDAFIVPSLRAVLYVNNSVRNLHMARYPGLAHIQLNHGDSDKSVSVSPVFRLYDKNFVAGQAAIDRFGNAGVPIDRDAFVIVGRPQLEDVEIDPAPVAGKKNPVVLYAPTWNGNYSDSRYSSLATGPELVRLLLQRGCDVIFRPHPRARSAPALAAAAEQVIELLADDDRLGAAHVFGPRAESDWSITDCFNHADALVSDVSSVANDFLYSEKPFAMMAVSKKPERFVEEFPIARAAYVIDSTKGRLKNAGEQLDVMLGSDPLLATRRELKAYYLGEDMGERGAAPFFEAIRQFIE